MTTFGFQITGYKPGAEYGHLIMREFDAPDRETAREAMRMWVMVEGYDPDRSRIGLIADGMTMWEHMNRELINMAARMSLRHGVSLEGPFVADSSGGVSGVVARLWLSNGRGVSVASKLTESGSINSELFPVREEPADRDGYVLDGAGVMEYSAGIDVGEGADGDISDLIGKIAAMPHV